MFVCLFIFFLVSFFQRPIRDSVFLIRVNMGDRVSKNLMVIGASAHPTTKEKTVSSPSVSLYNGLGSFGSWVPTSRCSVLTILLKKFLKGSQKYATGNIQVEMCLKFQLSWNCDQVDLSYSFGKEKLFRIRLPFLRQFSIACFKHRSLTISFCGELLRFNHRKLSNKFQN